MGSGGGGGGGDDGEDGDGEVMVLVVAGMEVEGGIFHYLRASSVHT